MKRLPVFFIIAFFAGASVAGIKYIAVVETDIDAQSGASATLTSADARLVTAELRREAVKNLPRDRYSIMTSETVQSMSGSVLEECAEENCVIALGSKIGADFIVRGTISKFQTKFTLTVEIYETDNGTLVGFSDPVRSENVADLLEKAAAACADMYRTFASEQLRIAPAPTPIPAPIQEPALTPEPTPAPAAAEPKAVVKKSAKPKPAPAEPKAVAKKPAKPKPAPEEPKAVAKKPAKPKPAPAPLKPKYGGIVSIPENVKTINVPENAKTISDAMFLARRGYDTVRVASGVYREQVMMAPNVALISAMPFGAKIDGGGMGVVVTMAENSSVAGFEVRNGAIGILCSDSGSEIRRCRIIENEMTGIMAKRNLPQIEDNIIAFNGASGIQAWDVRLSEAAVSHNTIAYNGNHGIAVGGASEFVILNNVIAFNEWHGLKISQGSKKTRVSGNNFYGNLFQIGKTLPENNYAFDPAFVKPLAELNFDSDPGKCCKEKSASGENLGARSSY